MTIFLYYVLPRNISINIVLIESYKYEGYVYFRIEIRKTCDIPPKTLTCRKRSQVKTKYLRKKNSDVNILRAKLFLYSPHLGKTLCFIIFLCLIFMLSNIFKNKFIPYNNNNNNNNDNNNY